MASAHYTTHEYFIFFFNAQRNCVENVILLFSPPRRHVMLPKELAKRVPKTHLMSETEWRNLGVQQSQGWVHYMIHQPEPHILLFRRPLPNPKS
uniref:Cyclin-dependent kinases regulatory subunit n=1 Tax=Haplochromis burtoni TaxID=8153 RepID=A0A3Q2X4Q2_HAPBU